VVRMELALRVPPDTRDPRGQGRLTDEGYAYIERIQSGTPQ
jgi:hypothetical protein